MLEISRYCLTAATLLVAIATVCYLLVLTTGRRSQRTPLEQRAAVLAGVGVSGAEKVDSAPTTQPAPGTGHGMAWFGARLVDVALVLMSVMLVLRTAVTGHAPFANQYEFASSFAWGILLAFVFFQWRYRTKSLGLLVLPMALGMLLYAGTVSSEAAPLVPALQNQYLLPIHVITAVVGYGAAAVASGAAILFLISDKVHLPAIPGRDLLEEIGYRAVVVAFPLITLTNILGAIWADIAWGRYWSWDPKETASLVTWLIYGAYLHARVVRDWRGNRAAWLLILGFVAVLFTFFGNLFFGGLHSYA